MKAIKPGHPGAKPLWLPEEWTKWLCLLLLIILFFIPFNILRPVSSLDGQGHWVLACLTLALACWIAHPKRLPRGLAGLFFLGLMLVGGLSYEVVFHGFTTASIWIIIPAFLFGFVIHETGLGRRVTMVLLNHFRGNTGMIAVALLLSGIIFSMLTPSITVRIGIVMPIVLSVIKSLNLKERSREAAFIALISYTAIIIPGNGWLTGSLVGPMNMGFLPPALRVGLDWFSYSRALFFPWALVTVLLVSYVFLVFKPGKLSSPDTGPYREIQLPPISRDEKFAAFILSLCFLGYLTTPFHGFDAAIITVFGLVLLFITGTLEGKAISTGVNWEVVLFFGTIMSLAPILETAGITGMLGQSLQPVLIGFSGNPLLFVYFVLALTLALRFVDVVWGLTTIAILFAFSPALSLAGIHPIVLCYLNGVIQCFTIFHYMSPFAIMSADILEHRGWSEKHLFIYGLGYLISVALSTMPAVWYWQWLGLL